MGGALPCLEDEGNTNSYSEGAIPDIEVNVESTDNYRNDEQLAVLLIIMKTLVVIKKMKTHIFNKMIQGMNAASFLSLQL